MVRQTVLRSSCKGSTSRSLQEDGLALYAEFMQAMGIETLLDRHLPAPRSGQGLEASQYATPLSHLRRG